MIAAAIIVGIVTSGGSSPQPHAGTQPTGTAPATTATTGTGTDATQLLAQLNLTSPGGNSNTVGIAQVVRRGATVGVLIDAQGVPANTTHNAYAVWLYSSPSVHRFVGFVPNLVGKNGKLATEGQLPADAANYHQLLITLETESKPTHPGEVVLSGPFREHS